MELPIGTVTLLFKHRGIDEPGSNPRIRAAVEEGRAMTREEALAFAREET